MSVCRMDDSPWCTPGTCKDCDAARGEPTKEVTRMSVTHVAVTPRGLELGGYVKSERLVPRMHNQQGDKQMATFGEVEPVIKTEHDIEKAIEMVTALTRNLLSLPADIEVGVHIRPHYRQYIATVEVAGFVLVQKHARMSLAIEALLSDLSDRVHKRIAEAQALLSK